MAESEFGAEWRKRLEEIRGEGKLPPAGGTAPAPAPAPGSSTAPTLAPQATPQAEAAGQVFGSIRRTAQHATHASVGDLTPLETKRPEDFTPDFRAAFSTPVSGLHRSPDARKRDIYLPMVRTGVHGGETYEGLDYKEALYKMTLHYKTIIRAERGYDSTRGIPVDELRQIGTEAAVRAHKEIGRNITSSGLPYIQTRSDSQNIVDWFADKGLDYLAPFWATLIPSTTSGRTVALPFGIESDHRSNLYHELERVTFDTDKDPKQLRESLAFWYARAAPSTVLASWYLDDDPNLEFGSVEHVNKIRAGYDVLQDFHKVGEEIMEAVPGDFVPTDASEAWTPWAAGVLGTAAMVLLEPSIFWGIGGAAKVATKGYKAIRPATRAGTMVQRGRGTVEAIRKAAEVPAESVSDIDRAMQAGSRHVAAIQNMGEGADLAVRPYVPRELDLEIGRAEGYRKAAKKAAEQAGEERVKRQKILDAGVEKAEEQRALMESRWAEIEYQQVAAENIVNGLQAKLKATAMRIASDEEAAEHLLGRIPKLQPEAEVKRALRNLKGRTTRGKKKAKALRERLDELNDLIADPKTTGRAAYQEEWKKVSGELQKIGARIAGEAQAESGLARQAQYYVLKRRAAQGPQVVADVQRKLAEAADAAGRKARELLGRKERLPKGLQKLVEKVAKKSGASAAKIAKAEAEALAKTAKAETAEHILSNYRASLRRKADSLEAALDAIEGGADLNNLRVFEETASQAVAYIDDTARQARKFNGPALSALLTGRYGKTLEKYADNPLLQKALSGAKGEEVILSWDEVQQLDRLERGIMVEASHAALREQGLVEAKVIIDSWNDFSNISRVGKLGWFQSKAKWLAGIFDPKREWGDVGEGTVSAVKAGMAWASRGMDEFQEVLKQRKPHETYSSVLSDYLDKKKIFRLRNGQTSMNQGVDSITTRAVNAILNDSRVWADGGTSKVVQGLARAWLGGGVNVPQETAKALESALKTFLRKAADEGRTLTFNEISDAIRKITRSSRVGGALKAESSEGRALGIIGGLLVHSAAQGEMAARIARALGPGLSPEMGDALVNLYSKGASGAESSAVLFQAAARMGVPLTAGPTLRKGWIQVTEASREIVQIQGTREGEALAYIPKHLMEKFDTVSGKLIKDLAAYYYEPSRTGDQLLWSSFLTAAKLWRTSVTTGIGLANPRHWVNAIFGDAAQMHVDQGLWVAGKRTFNNIPYNIPWMRRAFDQWSIRLADATGGTPLGSLTNAVTNPHIAKIWEGSTEKFISKSGQVLSYDDLLKWGIEDDILETFYHHDMLETLQRSEGHWAKVVRGARGLQDITAGHMIAVQQRQRMGLYAELIINKGATREEAAKAVKNALYDWKHGVTEWELNSIARLSAFYRYQRLAVQQVGRHLIAPLVAPTGKGAAAFYRTNIPLNRLRQQALLVHGLPEFLDFTDEDELLDDSEQFDYLARNLMPEFYRNNPRPVVGGQTDPIRREWDLARGKDHTHVARVFPDTGTLSSLEILLGFGTMAFGAAKAITGQSEAIPEGFWRRSALSITDMSLPLLGAAGEALSGDERMRRLRPGEESRIEAFRDAKLHKIPILGEVWAPQIRKHPDRNFDYISSFDAEMMRLMPVVGTTLPAYYSAFAENPYEDTSKYFGHVLTELTGFGRAIGYNPYQERDWLVRDYQKQIDQSEKDVAGEAARVLSSRGQRRK
jgi:hypothetical protein